MAIDQVDSPPEAPGVRTSPSADDSAAEDPESVTALLSLWRAGDAGAVKTLFPLVYRELRRLAHRKRRAVAAGETLRTTALVHEAYLKLVDQSAISIQSRQHFFALAARIMRQVLVDAGRRRRSAKRGGDVACVPLDLVAEPSEQPAGVDLLILDAALSRLGAMDEGLLRVVELRVFCGLTVEETADLLGRSPRTVKRDWRKARAFLFDEIGPSRIPARVLP